MQDILNFKLILFSFKIPIINFHKINIMAVFPGKVLAQYLR